jgi:L-threonylcarbamoyladenylate synthase
MKNEIIRLTSNGLLSTDSLFKLIDVVGSGDCIVLPADTCYIFVVDALNIEAVKKLYDIKRRSEKKAIHVCVSSINHAHEIGEVNRKALKLLENFTPGPITVVVKKKNIVPDLLVGHTGTIGIRIPDSPCILQFCSEFKKPITATSANLSGNPVLNDPLSITKEFGDKIEYCISAKQFKYDSFSTVVKATDEDIQILRSGPIDSNEIMKASNSLNYSDIRDWT